MDRGEQHFLQTSVDTQHRLLDNLANQLFEKRPVDLVDVLKGAGWAFVNSKLSQIEETDEPRPPSAHARVLPGTFRIPDLTDEQMQLLRQIVNVHEGGCQEEFLVERSFDGAQLSYPGSQDAISITASDSDFERLTTQDLISLGTNRQGMLRGKPTNNGIKFIANRSEAASSGEDIRTGLTPMGARDPEEPSQSPKYDLFLSYSSANTDDARKLHDEAKKMDLRVFMASRNLQAGDNFSEAIRSALVESREVCLLATPQSVKSQWVATEWGAAWVLKKRITPLLLQCQVSDLPHRLQEIQCKDFHEVTKYLAEVKERREES